jgi:DNA-binding transcriptional ArsR family regulator
VVYPEAMAAFTRKRVDNLATLRALTHPLRTRLLGALRADGPATASELGRRFDESSGATSYHLRQLARYGFVVGDDEQPSRREKRWRAAHELSSWDVADFMDDPASRSALRVLDRERIRWMVDRLQEWYAERPDWPREWVSAAQDSDITIRLRPDDLAELSRELWDVVARHAEQQQPDDDVGAERVVVYLHAFPTKDVVG